MNLQDKMKMYYKWSRLQSDKQRMKKEGLIDISWNVSEKMKAIIHDVTDNHYEEYQEYITNGVYDISEKSFITT